MRLRKNQAADFGDTFGASLAKACAARVCQPLPLARQAALIMAAVAELERRGQPQAAAV